MKQPTPSSKRPLFGHLLRPRTAACRHLPWTWPSIAPSRQAAPSPVLPPMPGRAGPAQHRRASLLPGIVYHNQFLYTQDQNGTAVVQYVASNAVHEYISQGVVSETVGGAGITSLRLAAADAASSRARPEIARRVLVLAVVNAYYAVTVADDKFMVARRGLDEASRFSTTTRQREDGGEIAHADTVRADIQLQQRQRELNEAALGGERSRLDLAVLLFPDPTAPYQFSSNLAQLPTSGPPSGAFRPAVAALHLPKTVHIAYGGTFEEQNKSFAELTRVLILALVLVFGVLLAEFRNLRAPFAILVSSILSTAGVIAVLLITQTTFSVASFMGFIMVIGLVGKNGILLLDAEARFRAAGMAPEQAILQAGRRRLRPILMTALAAITGMLPLAFAIGAGSPMLQPLAIAVIGGLLISMLLSLIVTPVVFFRLSRQRHASAR